VFGSALEAAEKLRGREVSARELVDAVFTQIEKVNPRVNAVVELRREAALDEARAADEALAVGESLGPLHGVPMTVKDSFNVVGGPPGQDGPVSFVAHAVVPGGSRERTRTSESDEAGEDSTACALLLLTRAVQDRGLA
jgi:hypothetical protein